MAQTVPDNASTVRWRHARRHLFHDHHICVTRVGVGRATTGIPPMVCLRRVATKS